MKVHIVKRLLLIYGRIHQTSNSLLRLLDSVLFSMVDDKISNLLCTSHDDYSMNKIVGV